MDLHDHATFRGGAETLQSHAHGTRKLTSPLTSPLCAPLDVVRIMLHSLMMMMFRHKRRMELDGPSGRIIARAVNSSPGPLAAARPGPARVLPPG